MGYSPGVSQNWELLLNKIAHDKYLVDVNRFFDSAWIGHSPFLKYLIREQQPSLFVELGVHNGFSFFVACQSILENKLSAQAVGIDHWEGDSQAGYFEDTVYLEVCRHQEIYKTFSKLLKSKFEDALIHFENGSIDLLHIDGFHSYESVKSDFESWLPKMSKDGIVLLHDIHVRRDAFGVYKLWNELIARYRTIEFVHSHGLGVVFLGEVPPNLVKLFDAYHSGFRSEIQGTFGSISNDVLYGAGIAKANSAVVERDAALSERDSAVVELDAALSERDSAVVERDAALSERDSAVVDLEQITNSRTWRLFAVYRKLITIIKEYYFRVKFL